MVSYQLVMRKGIDAFGPFARLSCFRFGNSSGSTIFRIGPFDVPVAKMPQQAASAVPIPGPGCLLTILADDPTVQVH